MGGCRDQNDAGNARRQVKDAAVAGGAGQQTVDQDQGSMMDI